MKLILKAKKYKGIDKKEVSKLIKQLINEAKVHSPKFCYYDAT